MSGAVAVWTLFAFAGCAFRVGHKTIAPDRFDYGAAIARSWKEQLLLNTVRMRYLEPPLFLDVAQIITQYTLEGTATVNTPGWAGDVSGSAASIAGRWAESPTITYNPMNGEKFTKSILSPVSPISLLSLVQAGWPVDVVFSFGIQSINGVHAGSRATMVHHAADPDFYRLLRILRELQTSDAFGFRVKEDSGKGEGEEEKDVEKGAEKEPSASILVFHTPAADPALVEKAKEVRKMLRLDPDANEFRIGYGVGARKSDEIRFMTRSILEILVEASMGVDIPPRHLDDGRATKVPDEEPGAPSSFLVRVKSSPNKPPGDDVFTTVHYRNTWFWVSDRDLQSKRGLGLLLVLFTMAESGSTAALPVLTISKP